MKAGVPNLDALALYKSLVRPVLEFAAPAFHPLLTETQKAGLERLQAVALKVIFGWTVSYATALEGSNTETLEERRNGLVKRFADKCVVSDRFSQWFKKNRNIPYGTRNREKYYLKTGRTTRYQKNPIYYMTRYLNGIT